VEIVAMLMKPRDDGGIRSEAAKELKHEVEMEAYFAFTDGAEITFMCRSIRTEPGQLGQD
jgi:hypothetical protein